MEQMWRKIRSPQMNRTLCGALAAAAALLVASGAQAKAPPDGVDVCGASGACVHVTMDQAEANWALWAPPASEEATRPSAVAPFLVVRWHWPGATEQTAYYVPATDKVRQANATDFAWYSLSDAASIRTLTANLDTYPIPTLTRVTVGGRAVSDPQSYIRLFGMGTEVFPAILPRWLGVRFTADEPSPWTDGRNDVRVSRTGRLLWLDGTMLRIPLRLAQRIRARRSLGS